MPLVSIIAACRNGATTIERMLDSIVCQTFRDFELIIIDGASTDGTQDFLRKHNELISYWVSEPDNSIAEAWNKGLARARGEWILFLGVDDALDRATVLEDMAPHLNDATTDLVYGKTLVVNGLFDGQMKGEPFNIKGLRRSMTLPHNSIFHARHLFDEVGLFDPEFQICLDYDLLLRKRDLTGLFVPIIVARMNGADTTSTSNPIKSFADAAKAQYKNRSMSLPSIWLRFLREVAYNYWVRLKRRVQIKEQPAKSRI